MISYCSLLVCPARKNIYAGNAVVDFFVLSPPTLHKIERIIHVIFCKVTISSEASLNAFTDKTINRDVTKDVAE
jgi:hypothetical protein